MPNTKKFSKQDFNLTKLNLKIGDMFASPKSLKKGLSFTPESGLEPKMKKVSL